MLPALGVIAGGVLSGIYLRDLLATGRVVAVNGNMDFVLQEDLFPDPLVYMPKFPEYTLIRGGTSAQTFGMVDS